MAKFNFLPTPIPDLWVVEPTVYGDARGYFMETYNDEFTPYLRHQDGSPASFVQDNESHSGRGVLRGLHMQRRQPQGKLVRVTAGAVFDVAVDARPGSPTLGRWHGVTLSADNKRQFLVPEGFLHGFLVLSESATFVYKCTRFYAPADEYGVMWNDADIGVEWPLCGLEPRLSAKDRQNHAFRELTAWDA